MLRKDWVAKRAGSKAAPLGVDVPEYAPGFVEAVQDAKFCYREEIHLKFI